LYEKKNLKIIPLIAFTLVGCAGGVTIKDTEGNKITFKREDVSCRKEYDDGWSDRWFEFTANGVVEDLAGNKYAQQYLSLCNPDPKAKERATNIACVAGLKFGLY
tara:strand:- start:508 stop:822 length:315 start_codon:yes stop_codon:yes gene_type:complete